MSSPRGSRLRGNDKNYKNIILDCRYITRYDGKESDDFELEDFIYPEIFFKCVNKFLRKNKYKLIRSNDIKKRTLLAYDKKPILQFVTEICRANNEDKREINFNSLSMKLYLSKTICNEIEKIDLEEIDKNNPKVKEFLNNLISTFN